jgi:hypothetical protein
MTVSLVNVFVSSTWLDLQPEREAVERALQRLRETKFVGMKYFGSRDENTRQTSLDEVDRCQVYIGIFGGRYGSGITEAEYHRARELGLYCLIYFKDEDAIAPEWKERDPPEGAARLVTLKGKLRQAHIVSIFTTPDDLAAKVTADLHRWLFDEYLAPRLEQATRGEFPREEAQALLAAVRDLSALRQDLLAQLRERSYVIASSVTQVAGDYHEHHHYPAAESPTIAPSYLPPKAYHRLVGRFDELDQVMSALREPKRKPMVAVVGLGGIGKTALAREAAERCWQEKLFDYIVWRSFKAEHFVGEGIIRTGVSAYSFDELLTDIGRQCDRVDVAQMPADQKLVAVKYLLANKRVLVVMDNLETVPESESLVASIFQILGQSKLLITSRHRVKHERVFTLDLGGFPEDEGVTFLREESRERGIEAVAQAGRESLVVIHQVTGGAPLAMRLVVGQMSRQPMDAVLDTLKEAAFKGPDYPFYRFIYQHSWEMLEMNARMALVDMSVFPPITGGAMDDVQAVSQVEPPAFWSAMDQLVMLSLVDKTGPAGRERFALHPLTHYFILCDITQEWGES